MEAKTTKVKLFGFIAMAAMIGLGVTGCDNGTKHSHEWEWVVTTAPTCEDAGVETETCALDPSHTNGTRPIAALGHEWEWVITKAATADEDGLETETCSVCGEESGETRPIPKETVTPHVHTWGDWEVTTPATCTTTGTGTRVCTDCGETDPDTTIPINPDAHVFGADWESDNDQHWRECECGETEGDEAHTVATWTQTKAPTILAEGEESGTCTVCEATVTQPIPMLTSMIDVVRINAGKFQMGSPEDEPGRIAARETQHEVTLTAGFYMGAYPVTQEQYQAVMGSLPTSLSTDTYGKGDNYPIYYVSWYDALVFCNKLSVMEGLTPAYSIDGETDPEEWGTVPTSSDATWNAVEVVEDSNGYRLPTEAQWEYACRAGTTTAFNWNTDYIDDSKANYNASYVDANNTTAGTYLSKTTEVGSYAANEWGLYDMHGNVFEWCWDWYGGYESGAQEDPMGASSGSSRVIRGGGWNYYGQDLRSANRSGARPIIRNAYLGFRLLRP